MEILTLLLTGLSIGFLSSFFGIGGGSLIVPVLYSLYPQMSNSQVISTSLITIFFLTINNSIQYYKIGLLPSREKFFNIFISASIGAIAGANLTLIMDTATSKKVLGVLLIVLALKMAIDKKGNHPEDSSGDISTSWIRLSLVCFAGAFISSLTGLGGGALFIPLFISLVRLPYKLLSPFSNVAMLVSTLIGSIPYLLQNSIPIKDIHPLIQQSFIGHASFAIALFLFLSSFLSSKIGVRLNDKISNKTKKLSLAALLLILGIKILVI